jgi:hypothetical protein
LLLFLEFFFIRWLGASIRILAYFSNFVLISCFLGFGLGCLLKRRRDMFRFVPPLTLLLIEIGYILRGSNLGNLFSSTEFIWGASRRPGWVWVIGGIFLLMAALFACMGQRVARSMDELRPLEGYTLNIAGSLSGTLLFSALAAFRTLPAVWFCVAGALTVWLLRIPAKSGLLAALFLLPACGLIIVQQRGAFWSPYYRVDVRPLPDSNGSFELDVNHNYHQFAWNLSNESIRRLPGLRPWREIYDFPYHIPGIPAKKALVLGAGSGNDVAGSLRSGVLEVVAVELDPVIFAQGDLHPEHPYRDRRVRAVIHDARHFLRHNPEKFDLIVLGWLDSHRIFSSLSNVRQDNFVYTVEAMREARNHLRPDGALVLNFYIAKPWLAAKIYRMLELAFGHAPVVFVHPSTQINDRLFLIRRDPGLPIPPSIPGFVNVSEEVRQSAAVIPPTDDWPFLYYESRFLSHEYGVVLAVIFLSTLFSMAVVLPRGDWMHRDLAAGFLMGIGFLLLETKNITALALIYGSTWQVTSVVLASVLVMILLGNLWVESGWAPGTSILWSLLFVSLAVALFFPTATLDFAVPRNTFLLTTAVSMTFLFASLLFARLFQGSPHPSRLLGFNVVGAVLGGLLEYGSLVWGLRALLWISVAVYGAACIFYPRLQVD